MSLAAGGAAPQLFFEPKAWSRRYGDDFFTVTIPTHKIVNNKDGAATAAQASKVSRGTHGAFVIQGRRGDLTWHVERRYSEFVRLHARGTAGAPPTAPDAPPAAPATLPPKSLWWTAQDQKFLERRRSSLEAYLHRLLARRGVCALPHVWDFLSAGAVSVGS